MGIEAAVIGSALIGGAVSSSAASKSAKAQQEASKTASDTQLTAARETNALTKEMYDQNRADLEPWRTAGSNALNQLVGQVNQGAPNYSAPGAAPRYNIPVTDANFPTYDVNDIGTRGNALNQLVEMIKTGPGQFEADPGYQFRLDEGTKALDRSAAARGRLNSGAQQKAITKFGQDYASNEYQNFIDRYYQKAGFLSDQHGQHVDEWLKKATFDINQYTAKTGDTINRANFMRGQYRDDATDAYNRYNFMRGQYFEDLQPLQSLAGVGQTSTNALVNLASNYANQVGNTNMNTANNVANNTVNAGNARASGYINTANALTGNLQSGINNYLVSQALKQKQLEPGTLASTGYSYRGA